MTAKILMVNGHPDAESYCSALCNAYTEGALTSSAHIEELHLHELNFELSLQFGYRQRTELEEDLIRAQELIKWADHIVFVYPLWWGSMPALLKGFVDRVFLPGFAFKYRENSSLWDKLLTGKTAHLIITTDTPSWYNRLIYQQSGQKIMKRNILQFCGINKVRISEIGPIKPSKLDTRLQWLEKVKRLGFRQL